MATHIGLVLDMSGSMSVAHESTVQSLKRYIKSQKKEDPEAIFSLLAFDDRFEQWVSSTPIGLIKTSEIVKKYAPRGMTALYDAIGKTISSMGKSVKKTDKAIVVIITDGYENASREYNNSTIKSLIDGLQKKNWTFIFLGANIDSAAVAQTINIPLGNTSDYTFGQGQFRAADSLTQIYRSVASGSASSTTSAFADAGVNTNEFTEKEEKKEKENDVATTKQFIFK